VTFNAAGYALSDTRALGQPEQQTVTYERQAGTNLRTAEIDALGRRTEYTYWLDYYKMTYVSPAESPGDLDGSRLRPAQGRATVCACSIGLGAKG
jgi:hypothetical protein